MPDWKRLGRASKRTAVVCLLMAGLGASIVALSDLCRNHPNYGFGILLSVVIAVIFWLSYTYPEGD